jgi:glycosyltransferase involved in cell wall biosynthesis
MRVLHVYSGNLYGGIETLLVTLARYRGHCPAMEPHFALCFPGRLSDELTAAGVGVHLVGPVRVSRPWTVWRGRRGLARLLSRQAFDVVIPHGAWPYAIFAPVVRAAGGRLGIWLHDPPDGRLSWLDRWARRVPPDLAVCNSHYTLERLPQLFPRVPGRVVYCTVPVPDAAPGEEEREATRSQFHAPPGTTVILQIGRWEPHKGHLAHMEALGMLRDVPGWVCWQVGGVQRDQEARYLERVKQAATRLGIAERVRFLGWQPDVRKLLAAADIYCQPNVGPEPFGITFVEALFARLPVVASALGGPKEILDESCGVLLPPGDTPALAGALRRLIADCHLRTQLGAAGPARARHLCDPATQIRRLHDVLSDAMPHEKQRALAVTSGGCNV